MGRTKPKSFLKLEDILYNEVTELPIPALKTIVRVKDPTVGQRLAARTEATKLTGWKLMDDISQGIEIQKLVALKMLVDIDVSTEEYLQCNDITIVTILEYVARYYTDKVRKLTEKKNKEINTFLEQKKES